MKPHIFRENDIRGIVGEDLNEETVTVLAKAIGTYFRQNQVQRVSIGYDARESSLAFRHIFAENLNLSGLDVLDIGMVPTPLVYFSLFTEAVEAGVMITGSHNPASHNGFKICLGQSALHGAEIRQIRDIANAGKFENGVGTTEKKNIIEDYVDYVASRIEMGERKLKVVVDAGNGVAGIAATYLYERLGCETVNLFFEPDSRFPHHHPDPADSENMRDAIEALHEKKADLALVFDGDGDRLGVSDERGNIIWGDELLAVFARSILEKQPGAAIIAEVKCSQRLFADIEKRGGQAIMWKVGHSLIKAKMRETGAVLAGEMSGHFFFADRFFGFDDAIYAGARLLEILSQDGRKLSEFLDDLPDAFITPEIRLDCPDEKKFEVVTRLTERFKETNQVIDIDGARIIFENGWGLIRPSNTQPVLTLRFEADDEKSLAEIKNSIETAIDKLIKET